MKVWRRVVVKETSENENQLFICQDMATMETFDKIYARAGTIEDTGGDSTKSLVDSSQTTSIPDCTYHWPLINRELASNVEKQLRESVSIYNNGGIFGTFEHA